MPVSVEEKAKKEEVLEKVQATLGQVIAYKQSLFEEKRAEVRRLLMDKAAAEVEQVPAAVAGGEEG